MTTRFRKRRSQRLRHRVTFQEKPGTLDDHGQPDVAEADWDDVASVSAEVMEGGGGANTRDGQLEEQTIVTVLIRRPKSGDRWYPTVEMRVKHDSRTLNIRRLLRKDDNQYLELQCVEVA